MTQLEENYGAAMTYAASAANAGAATWAEQNWFLLLSAVAILIRIGIDLPRLYKVWKQKSGP